MGGRQPATKSLPLSPSTFCLVPALPLPCPDSHTRHGIPATTLAGAIVLAAGVLGWATAVQPWQLFAAATLTGGGWVPLGAAGVNAIIAPWVPTMGVRLAGGIMALATGCGMGGRLIMARLLSGPSDRRRAAAASYALQALGTLLLWTAGPEHLGIFVLGMVLFGLGIGNATSMPPLIAQAEFAPADVARVVARSVALSQALYAFAPALLAGLIVGGSGEGSLLGSATGAYFAVIFSLQAVAAACLLGGRSPPRSRPCFNSHATPAAAVRSSDWHP